MICAFFGLDSLETAKAGTVVNISSSSADRWMYAFNSTPGFRGLAPTFSAIGETAFDDMDGQFLVGIDTAAAGVTPLGPGEAYQINSMKLTVTHSTGALIYDPTFDNYATYLDPGDVDALTDSDAGRPIELYGAGLRGGFSGYGFDGGVTGPPTFNDGSPFAFADPTLPGVRNSYAYDTVYGDVSNAIDGKLLDARPWAIGQAEGLSAGDAVSQGVPGVSAGETFTFDIDLTHTGVHDYLAQGLEDGGLFFTIVSLHETSQTGGSNPNFYTSSSFDPAAIAPTVVLDYDIVQVPEPATLTMGLIGLAVGLGVVIRRRRASGRQS